jgi:hypothetical protein
MIETLLISHDLKIALEETIQAHADRHQRGKVDLEKMISVLGEIGSDFLAKVPELDQRRALYWTMINGLIGALRWKAENRAERVIGNE